MRELTDLCLNKAQKAGCAYADIRIIKRERQEISLKSGNVEAISVSDDLGFGVRVLKNGAWGFASSRIISSQKIEEITSKAVEIAEASARVKDKDVELAPVEPVVAKIQANCQIDPFTVPLEEKLQFLARVDDRLRSVKGVAVSKAFLAFFKEFKVFASTDGSFIEQEKIESGGGMEAIAVGEGDFQIRSFPNSMGGNTAAYGYEFIPMLKLEENAERIAQEAVALLKAKPCPSGEMDIILDSSQLALQIHESCGHPTELDRVLGTEASYAGTSFMTPDLLGKLQYGSKYVNIYADATAPGGLGSFAYDDEGAPAQCVDLVKEGLFVGYLTSRETAHALGIPNSACMRADGWGRMPIIRMTNISLKPGDATLEEIIADTKKGLYLITNRSWSIDDKRLNFQFGTEMAYEIKNGKLGAIVKNATYTGMTPQFWNSCDAVANKDYWTLWGLTNCGKGQPSQVMHVGHGASPARFRKVQVGVMK
ncbi:MAG: TldD/PmbA family protein [Caldiserica bacterium]|nr:TldD/PmbA family protein [Caldisericota bacterium]